MDLRIDFSAFERKAALIGGAVDQVPFALSRALNDAVKQTRQHLVQDVWPTAVQVRNRGFIGAALRMEFSTKHKLEVSIYDRLGRAHLALHAKGGTKQARGRLAIPTKRVARGASGVRRNQLPRNLKRAVVKGDMIFQATGRGKNSRLLLMYALRKAAQIRKDVPFVEQFKATMMREAAQAFPERMVAAMKSRR
jgi:hypothetical protein